MPETPEQPTPATQAAEIECPICRGKGTLYRPCSMCGDSTYDHFCDDGDTPCRECKGTGKLSAPTQYEPRADGGEDAKLLDWADATGHYDARYSSLREELRDQGRMLNK